MKAIKYIFIFTASLFIFNSCTKQVAGPQGTQGPQGPQGPSAGYTVTLDSVKGTGASWPQTNGLYTATLTNIAGLTDPNYCIVQVYVSTSYNALSTWTPLPAANFLAPNDAMSFYYTTNRVVIQYTPSQPTQELYFKTVVAQP